MGFWYLITKNVLTPSLCSLCVVNVAKNLAMFFLLPNKDHRCKVKYERHRLTTLNIFPFMCNIFLNILTMPVDYLFFNFNVWILINLVCFLITGGSDNQSLMILYFPQLHCDCFFLFLTSAELESFGLMHKGFLH